MRRCMGRRELAPAKVHSMSRYSFTLLTDATLLQELDQTARRSRETTAMLLAQMGEVDERRAYLPRAYPSMHAYCVGHLHFSEDSAWKRIQAARGVRAVPAMLDAIADGRLHLSAVIALAPHVTRENAAERIAAASHRTLAEVRGLVTAWSASETGVDGAPLLEALAAGASVLANFTKMSPELDSNPVTPEELSVRPNLGTETVLAPTRRPVTHLFDDETLALLEELRNLLAHQVPSGDPAEVLKLCMREKLTRIQRRRCGASADARAHHVAAARMPLADARHIPGEVRREVWDRDAGACTFESDRGHRCGSRRFVEFDHVIPIARGGVSTADNLRLRCRAHNQFEARRVFGDGFMERKREAAQVTAAEEHRERAAIEELLPALESLGLRGPAAREAASVGAAMKDATIEDRMRAVLKWLGRRNSGRLTRTGS